jgi:hypothetical protein
MIDRQQQWRAQARRATFEDYRQQRSSTWVEAQGNSMRPLVRPGTWMHVEFGAPTHAVGDIILFPLGDLIVAHRIVAVQTRGGRVAVVPKGDAEPYPDPSIEPAAILGIVRALRRGKTGASTTSGCAGMLARITAALSRANGRFASALRTLAAFLPTPIRRVALGAIPPFLRVVACIFFSPLLWATWRDISLQKNGRR